MRHPSPDGLRLITARRIIQCILFMRSLRTRREIAEHLGVSLRSTGRYIQAVEAIGIPVIVDIKDSDARVLTYRIDQHWLRKFL